ncbi:hypothetical protein AUC70_02130 [Methyloceanibacter stevinii]|uniref:Uncharacterized protein n=1 Tax=Methyloceanibacter stevinii TaxID=1774970 RepID=A0A1E3VRY4_9HYPH|nr:hypothetical protein AUC70_02130 [Methyloceanibacter stevinii]
MLQRRLDERDSLLGVVVRQAVEMGDERIDAGVRSRNFVVQTSRQARTQSVMDIASIRAVTS